MGRIARVVVAGWPHHVTQRGNRRQQTFFRDEDYQEYKNLLAEWAGRHGVAVWAYCLMPNHVHPVAAPSSAAGHRRGPSPLHPAGELPRRLAGHLWQGRFGSVVMDEPHLLAAVRYVERNPVRADLVAAAHLAGADDGLVMVASMLRLVAD